MWKRRVIDIVFVVALFVAFTNNYVGYNRTAGEGDMTITRTTQEMIGVILLPPASGAFSPRAVAGIIFIITLIVGFLGLDFYSKRRR